MKNNLLQTVILFWWLALSGCNSIEKWNNIEVDKQILWVVENIDEVICYDEKYPLIRKDLYWGVYWYCWEVGKNIKETVLLSESLILSDSSLLFNCSPWQASKVIEKNFYWNKHLWTCYYQNAKQWYWLHFQ